MCSEQPGLGPGLSWSFSRGRGSTPTLFHGQLGPAPVTRVELRWHGGSQRLAADRRFFVGEVPVLADPPFARLPFDLVALGPGGRVVVNKRIRTSFLYTKWKKVQPELHRYRVAHGCTTKTSWRCRSR